MKSIHEGKKSYKTEIYSESAKNPSNLREKSDKNENKLEIENKLKQCTDYQKQGPKFKCPVCSIFFWSDNRMNYHIVQVHEKEQLSEKSTSIENVNKNDNNPSKIVSVEEINTASDFGENKKPNMDDFVDNSRISAVFETDEELIEQNNEGKTITGKFF